MLGRMARRTRPRDEVVLPACRRARGLIFLQCNCMMAMRCDPALGSIMLSHVLYAAILGLSITDAGSDASTSGRKPAGWVEHVVVPHERIDAIAGRYGVTREEVLRTNPGLRRDGWLRAGQTLRIRAHKRPPPRRRLLHVVARGQTWAGIAQEHGVSVRELRSWNQGVPQAFRAGTELVVFDDRRVAAPARGGSRRATVAPPASPRGEMSLVPLPESDHYRVRNPDRAFGTLRLVAEIERAVPRFRTASGYAGELVICDLSDHDGGRLLPHRSHRTGHDVDIRLPRREDGEVDWDATWALVAAFLEGGEIEYVFLDHPLQAELAAAAERAGVDEAARADAIQWPNAAGTNAGVVRHEPGHSRHLHIRVRCEPTQERCS